LTDITALRPQSNRPNATKLPQTCATLRSCCHAWSPTLAAATSLDDVIAAFGHTRGSLALVEEGE
jgi:hypothetical protein